jgi:hypothetical protein
MIWAQVKQTFKGEGSIQGGISNGNEEEGCEESCQEEKAVAIGEAASLAIFLQQSGPSRGGPFVLVMA